MSFLTPIIEKLGLSFPKSLTANECWWITVNRKRYFAFVENNHDNLVISIHEHPNIIEKLYKSIIENSNKRKDVQLDDM